MICEELKEESAINGTISFTQLLQTPCFLVFLLLLPKVKSDKLSKRFAVCVFLDYGIGQSVMI